MASIVAKSRTKAVTAQSSDSPAKRAPGRPLGSKNRVVAGKVARPSLPAQTASGKTRPTAPKMSKADLEAQVIKLERALARSRKHVTELKLMMSEAASHVPAPAERVSKEKPLKKKPAATRGGRKKSEADETVLAGATGEDETEAHAS